MHNIVWFDLLPVKTDLKTFMIKNFLYILAISIIDQRNVITFGFTR